jgi:hypothetical protein
MHRSPLPILADFLFLHNLLNEKSLDHQSFESISAHVQKKFQKNDLISVGNLLSLLLKNNDLAETNNRLVAYYLLYDIFRNDNEFDSTSAPRDSPFIYFLYQIIDSKDLKLTQVERNFIVQLLASGVKDVSTYMRNQKSMADSHSNTFQYRLALQANAAPHQTNRSSQDTIRFGSCEENVHG